MTPFNPPDGSGATESGHESARRDFVESYSDLINELGLLVTVSTLLFGFLLAVRPTDVSDSERWLFFAAIIAVATATALFALPIFYHQIRFPYSDWERFQWRAHSFMMAGFPALALGFYLSLTLAVWDFVRVGSFVVAAIPVVAVCAVFAGRRVISPKD